MSFILFFVYFLCLKCFPITVKKFEEWLLYLKNWEAVVSITPFELSQSFMDVCVYTFISFIFIYV